MKRTFWGLFSAAICIGLVGCNSVPKMDSDESMFDYMQAKVGEIGDEGGMASLGMASSAKPRLPWHGLRLMPRKNLAQLVVVKIENLEKAFVEEIGDADSSEVQSDVQFGH